LQRSDALQPRDASLLLNDRVLSAIQLQSDERQKILKQGESESSDRFLREIYIYTDRARSAWSLETASRLKEEMEQVPWLRCYILDVGVETATNFSLNNLAMSQATVIQGGLVTISAGVTNQSLQASECVAELYLGDSNGSAVKRDQVALTLEANQTGQASFTITTDTLGVLQGEIRIAQSDPLKIDNTAAFSLMVKPRPNVLIVAEKRNEAFVWEQALAPSQLVKRGVHQYTVKVITPSRLRAELELGQTNSQTKRPDVVYLMNVSRLSEKSWNSLQNYVQSGGGLGVFLGSTRIEVDNYRNLGQADWLAALPSVHVRPPSLKKIEVVQGDHPVFSYLEKLDVLGLYSSAAVRRYWKTELPEGASALANFSDDDRSAAVVARNYGRGRVLSVSTGVDLSGASEQRNWSDLARLDWIYAAWADQVTKYLQGGRNLRLNRTVGSPVVLTVSEEAQGKEALLQLPGLRQEKITIPFQGTLLKISSSGDPTSALVENRKAKRNRRVAADRVGSYRILFPAGSINPFGFSLQLADQETDLQPLSYAELDELFGVDRWQLSRTYEELERSVILGRIGTEAYPVLIILLIIIFLGEHLAANLFYGRQDG
ncbi:MAG: hypothetical protein JKY95_15875, partial [Planctomycetaceae bacterium]|nr:hypothetical protein [Planctomycetaceae bacterium]